MKYAIFLKALIQMPKKIPTNDLLMFGVRRYDGGKIIGPLSAWGKYGVGEWKRL
ncbi:hypothetical protein WSK_3605 [Novosphingobium sp. Rr 2-17]|uniref:hypothetical protein n=1 Tax=Novosphingobium sp. Rr 2-17 TaxID=555793 RepID=UPI000269AB9C|nr:hypothetical protein [Novosphingobium sp. Rr 2-17]EIZ77823.1 hypothetical protein WSK_3605 [Novosphingobium sp. Rr 2-17]